MACSQSISTQWSGRSTGISTGCSSDPPTLATVATSCG